MQFLVLGTFPGTTQLEIEKKFEQLGCIVSMKAEAQVLINNHSVTPHCYITIKSYSVLRAATEFGKIHQLHKLQMRECCIVLQGWLGFHYIQVYFGITIVRERS